MQNDKRIRYLVIAAFLLLGVLWSAASTVSKASEPDYPNARFLATAQWLQSHKDDAGLVIADVRMEKYFDGKLIPGAIHMPWRQFRHNDSATNMGGLFVGIEQAQQILGAHGIARNDTVVIYDSVARDGGATSSYIFWVLDLLGHRKMKVLERGIDGWIEAGGQTVTTAAKPEPVLYQASANEVSMRKWVQADFILPRLGDPYYQILDVRSREEYLGEKPNAGLDGTILKLGHVPTAYNINYARNWSDAATKKMKSYPELQLLYKGLDPNRAVIAYCHSARRGSFGYFVLRLMGFEDVLLYEPSWMEWGSHRYYYPAETAENILKGNLPTADIRSSVTSSKPSAPQQSETQTDARNSSKAKSGYISCGG